MAEADLRFRLVGASWDIVFSREVLRFLHSHAQGTYRKREVAGQLFTADLTAEVVRIGLATLLPATKGSRTSVRIDVGRADDERRRLFGDGLHCVGLWHTHPEPMPRPSYEDLQLAKDHALAARPNLTGIVFVIIGTMPFPAGLLVGVHDGSTFTPAPPCA